MRQVNKEQRCEQSITIRAPAHKPTQPCDKQASKQPDSNCSDNDNNDNDNNNNMTTTIAVTNNSDNNNNVTT